MTPYVQGEGNLGLTAVCTLTEEGYKSSFFFTSQTSASFLLVLAFEIFQGHVSQEKPRNLLGKL